MVTDKHVQLNEMFPISVESIIFIMIWQYDRNPEATYLHGVGHHPTNKRAGGAINLEARVDQMFVEITIPFQCESVDAT
jgi:hypothetical protein